MASGTLGVLGAGAFGGGLALDAGARFENASRGALTIGGTSALAGELSTGAGSATVFTGPVSGAGRFNGTGSVEFDGGYSPGDSPASVSFGGKVVLGGSNDLTMELGGLAPGTGYDRLSVAGRLDFGGRLRVVTLNGFSPTLGQSFDLFDFGSSNGSFASLSLPTLGQGLRWDISALYSLGVVRVQSVPEPASLAALACGAAALLRRRKGIRD